MPAPVVLRAYSAAEAVKRVKQRMVSDADLRAFVFKHGSFCLTSSLSTGLGFNEAWCCHIL